MNILAKQMKKSYLHLSLEFSAFYLKDKTILKEMSYNTSLVAMGFAEDEDNEVDKEFEDLNNLKKKNLHLNSISIAFTWSPFATMVWLQHELG